MKKLVLACGLAALSVSTVSHAELSANIGVTSNYLWRGVTQTDDGPAVSGGIDWSHDSGFYLGTWASNIDWNLPSGSNGVELDLYGGYAGEASGFGYDLGLIHYHYPDSAYDDSDFTEIYLNGSFSMISAGIAYTVSGDQPDNAAFSDGDLYYYVSVSADLDAGWSIGGTIGHYDFDVPGSAGDIDYTHYQVDIAKSAGDFGDFTFTLSKADEESGDDDTKIVVSWGKSF